MNRKVLILGVVSLLALVAVLAQGFGRDPRRVISPLLDKPAPEFELLGLDGDSVSLPALHGKPVLINFWATWCQPCIAEHDSLQRLAQRFEGRVEFLGIIYHDEEAPIRSFLAQRGTWGSTLVDPESLVAIRYGVYGAPETFLIDTNGTVVRKITGQLDEGRVSALLGELL